MSKKKMIVAIVAVIALVAILGVCLVACNAKSYEKKLKKAGYEVEVYSDEDLKESDVPMKWALSAYKETETSEEYVEIIKYKKSSDAKKAYNEIKEDIEEGYDVYRTGSIVMYGTKQGVKDAK